ncbi:hypothetical protein OL233_07510 [Vagococcus sp. PNs007]|uniref:Uncharacterized protein n=1 Tax=Vagococcus proximus TaxID=2991417 RepID=A0ABT5X2K7_9ENTE|nr:hypothetical protein [Vagococcus proximus]MDF0480139.1 hypothetical protein [Vagococcus proximus]
MSSSPKFNEIMEIYEENPTADKWDFIQDYKKKRKKKKEEQLLNSIKTIKTKGIKKAEILLFEREVSKKIKRKEKNTNLICKVTNYIIVIIIAAAISWMFMGSEELELHVNERRMDIQNEIINDLKTEKRNDDKLEKIEKQLDKVNDIEKIKEKEELLDDTFNFSLKYKTYKVYEKIYSHQFAVKLDIVKNILRLSTLILVALFFIWFSEKQEIKKYENILSFYDSIKTEMDIS